MVEEEVLLESDKDRFPVGIKPAAVDVGRGNCGRLSLCRMQTDASAAGFL
jgi:hypothetical protein